MREEEMKKLFMGVLSTAGLVVAAQYFYNHVIVPVRRKFKC